MVLTRSHALPVSIVLALAFVVAGERLHARDDVDDLMRRAKDDMEEGRYVAADSGFARAAAIAEGDQRAEALYLRASVVRSGEQAGALYQRVIDEYMHTEWGRPAALELAKIRFSMGLYEGARQVIASADLCSWSDEACVFDGTAAVMLRRYHDAIASLDRVERGRHKAWASVARAEAVAGQGDREGACESYAALARARVSPTAWFRHAECLEAGGDSEVARREYEALCKEFPQAPEAVRAAAKVAPLPAPVTLPATGDQAAPGAEGKVSLGGTGFTLQFGSFSDRANALKLAAQIKQMYPAVRVDSELINYREVFRVRYGQYATREEARQAGEAMSKTLDERYTVMPITRAADE
jgi:tetratricopeptide (TPR) repeat protein